MQTIARVTETKVEILTSRGSSWLLDGRAGFLNGVAGAKHVESIHLPSLKRRPPEPITRRADVLVLSLLKAKDVTSPFT